MKINTKQNLRTNFTKNKVDFKKESIKDQLTLGGKAEDLDIMTPHLQSLKSSALEDAASFVEAMAIASLVSGGLGAIGSTIGGTIGGVSATVLSAVIGNEMFGPTGALAFGTGAAVGASMGSFSGAIVGSAIPTAAIKFNLNDMNNCKPSSLERHIQNLT